MKTSHPLLLALAALAVAARPIPAHAGIFSDTIDMVVVAERHAPEQPPAGAGFAIVDGGYIEAGDPIAGDTPPKPGEVAQAVQVGLSRAGFSPGADPSIVVTYHWGILRVDHIEIRKPYGIKSNLLARIQLVSTDRLAAEVENHIYLREKAGTTIQDAASPALLVGPARTAAELASQSRYLAILSAYDYSSLRHGHPRLLWRAKLSAREESGTMREVVPAMIEAGAPYFGKDLPEVQMIEATPASAPAASAAPEFPAGLDKALLGNLIRAEHQSFSGQPDS